MTTATNPAIRESDPSTPQLWVPRLILGAAAAHLLVSAVASASHWRAIAADGLWNTVHNDDDARMAALWFLISGFALLGTGLLTRRFLRVAGAVPAETGWLLLAIGVPLSVLDPVSGGWALIAIGAIAIVASRRQPEYARTNRPG